MRAGESGGWTKTRHAVATKGEQRRQAADEIGSTAIG